MRFSASRRTKFALGGLMAISLAAALAFGPVTRKRVAKEAESRGLVIGVGSVAPAWFAVELRSVDLKLEGVEGLEVKIESLRVDLTGKLSIEQVTASGVSLEATQTPEALADSLETWRARHPNSTGPSSSRVTPVSVEQLTVHWNASATAADDLEIKGASARRDSEGWHFVAETFDVTHGDVSLKIGTQSIDLDATRKLLGAHAATVDVTLVLHPASPEPAPPPLAPPPTATKKDEPFTPLVSLPDLRVLRSRVQSLADLLSAHMTDAAQVDVDALSLSIARDKESLSLGPGKATFARHPSSLDVEFITGQGATPFAVRASLPLGTNDVVASLSGGPVSLSMLGVREGAMGLQHTDKAMFGGKGRVVIDANGTALTFDGEASLHNLAITQPKLSTDPILGLDLEVSGRGVLDDRGSLRVDDGDLSMGALHLRGHGSLVQASDHFEGTMTMEVPAASCQSLLDSLPAALVPHLAGTRYRGTLSLKAMTQFDSRKLDELVLKYDVSDLCHTISVPKELEKTRFTGPFDHDIIDKDGNPQEITTGPNSESWTNIDDISPFMQVAVLTTEDGSFHRHHGFNHNAIRSSLIANLKAHKFVRGASTITMQLAKNLFLSRDKTISRKFEEVLLATYLEDTFTKQELMELYLNLIEFGPDVYGVAQAAEHYFGRAPLDLNLAESLFLATLLPNPIELHKKLYEKGDVPDWWMKRIQGLMQTAEKNGRISPAELQDALTQKIVFHREGDPRPTRRIGGGNARLDVDDWDTPR